MLVLVDLGDIKLEGAGVSDNTTKATNESGRTKLVPARMSSSFSSAVFQTGSAPSSRLSRWRPFALFVAISS